MYISRFQAHNYKSHLETPELQLTRGFNVITGQNNAGKTALLETMALQFSSTPHRSLITVPNPASQPSLRSWVDISFNVSRGEFRDILLVPDTEFALPVVRQGTAFAKTISYDRDDEPSASRLKNYIFGCEELVFHMRLEKGPNGETWALPNFPSFGLYQAVREPGRGVFSQWSVKPDRTLTFNGFARAHEMEDIGIRFGDVLRERIYLFRSERFNAGSSVFGRSSVLAPNAQNLAEVLNGLQHNRDRFIVFNSLVREIFPQIYWISVRPHPTQPQVLEIVVWNHDPKSERDDLTVPLNESGTGVGQVLAILYVVLTSSNPRTIIIDEPQSFLHRGASRKLIAILKRYPQHQFIVSTHSPTIITASSPQTIILIRQQESESVAETLNATEIEKQRRYLSEIGATPADVFGADNILWVEGETEQECYPIILEQIANRSLMGTVIRAIKHTGDLEGRHAELVFDIYDRLSHGKSLLPPALAFILDDEGRTAQQKAEIQRRSHNRAHFIPRRMYENYLLLPDAIVAVMNANEGFRDIPVVSQEVETVLTSKLHDARYYRPFAVPQPDDRLRLVDAARVLTDLFSEVSEARSTYDKLRHSVELTKWIIDHSPEELKELSDFIEQVLDASNTVY